MRAEGPPTSGAEVPDTAMASGSEYGEPGERTQRPPADDPAPASPVDPAAGRPAVEDSPAAARAVADDSVLPIEASDGDEADPLTPEFQAPPEP